MLPELDVTNPIHNARERVRRGFWVLGISAVAAVCGKVLDIGWLKTSQADFYFWTGGLGLLLLAQLIIDCTDYIVRQLSASKSDSVEESSYSTEAQRIQREAEQNEAISKIASLVREGNTIQEAIAEVNRGKR